MPNVYIPISEAWSRNCILSSCTVRNSNAKTTPKYTCTHTHPAGTRAKCVLPNSRQQNGNSVIDRIVTENDNKKK